MIPNYKSDVEAAKVKYQDAWLHAHTGDDRTEEFIRLLAKDLHAKDSNVALNGKRGDPNDISDDALNILCEEADSQGRTPDGRPCVVVDVIFAAGARPPYTPSNPAPAPTWGVLTTAVEGSGANVNPTPQPPVSSCVFPPQNESFDFGTALNTKYKVDRHAPLIGTDGDRVEVYVNLKGMTVWLQDYLRLRTAGKSHADAQAEVFRTIDQIPL